MSHLSAEGSDFDSSKENFELIANDLEDCLQEDSNTNDKGVYSPIHCHQRKPGVYCDDSSDIGVNSAGSCDDSSEIGVNSAESSDDSSEIGINSAGSSDDSSDGGVNSPVEFYDSRQEDDSARSVKLNSAASSHVEEKNLHVPKERSKWKELAENGEGYFETKDIKTSKSFGIFLVDEIFNDNYIGLRKKLDTFKDECNHEVYNKNVCHVVLRVLNLVEKLPPQLTNAYHSSLSRKFIRSESTSGSSSTAFNVTAERTKNKEKCFGKNAHTMCKGCEIFLQATLKDNSKLKTCRGSASNRGPMMHFFFMVAKFLCTACLNSFIYHVRSAENQLSLITSCFDYIEEHKLTFDLKTSLNRILLHNKTFIWVMKSFYQNVGDMEEIMYNQTKKEVKNSRQSSQVRVKRRKTIKYVEDVSIPIAKGSGVGHKKKDRNGVEVAIPIADDVAMPIAEDVGIPIPKGGAASTRVERGKDSQEVSSTMEESGKDSQEVSRRAPKATTLDYKPFPYYHEVCSPAQHRLNHQLQTPKNMKVMRVLVINWQETLMAFYKIVDQEFHFKQMKKILTSDVYVEHIQPLIDKLHLAQNAPREQPLLNARFKLEEALKKYHDFTALYRSLSWEATMDTERYENMLFHPEHVNNTLIIGGPPFEVESRHDSTLVPDSMQAGTSVSTSLKESATESERQKEKTYQDRSDDESDEGDELLGDDNPEKWAFKTWG